MTITLLILVLLYSIPSFTLAQDTMVPGGNLVIDGIPKIPLSLAQEVSRYNEFRRARFLDWHPLRKEMLINTRLGNTYQLHHVKFPGGARIQLTFYDDNIFSGRYQPTQVRYIVFAKDAGGDEQYQNYRYDLDTGAVTLLTDGKSRNGLGIWSRSGKQMAYTSTRRNGKDADLYVIDPSDPKTNRLVAQLEGGGWSPLDWAEEDQKILLLEEISINESYVWIVDGKSGEKTRVTRGDGEKVAYGEAAFSKDGKGVYLITDAGSEFRRLGYLDLKTNELKFLSPSISGDIDDFDLSADRSKIAFITNEEGIGKLYLLDPSSSKVRGFANLPVGVIGRVKWHRNGRYLGFTLSSARL